MKNLTPSGNPWAARVLLRLGGLGMRRTFRAWAIMLGCDLECRDYGRFFLPHPFGIVMHARTQIGQGCTIYQHVTIGTADGTDQSATIGDDVVIGAGAVLLGTIHIGHGARIGANAVVLTDVPAGATAVGNPARVRPASHDIA